MDGRSGKKGGSEIFCLSWVKRGAAKVKPDFITITEPELNDLKDCRKFEEDSDDGSEKSAKDNEPKATSSRGTGKNSTHKELEEYDLENYDDDGGDFQGFDGLYVYSNNADDPYIVKKGKQDELLDPDDELDEASTVVKAGDNLLLCARCSQHTSVLEVFVYNHSTKDFYVHHDIPLTETPLCMQWIGFDPGADDESGNLVAVGNFNSTIDIWDLDVINTLEPILTLGRNCNTARKKKSIKKRKFSHTDAILDLAWTVSVKDNLASASADGTVALWDLEMCVATSIFRDHSTKVQSIEWRPQSNSTLCSGAFDGVVYTFDKNTAACSSQWRVDGEVERISWNHHNNNYFVVSTDKGMISYHDCRKPKKNLLEWQGHEQPVPCLSIFNAKSKTFLSSASSDGFAKIWDLGDTEGKIPNMVYNKDMKIGMVHCSQGNPDENLVIAYGGQRDAIKLWDLAQTSELCSHLGVSAIPGGSDTMKPEGGGGEDDDEVVRYVTGGDYVTQSVMES